MSRWSLLLAAGAGVLLARAGVEWFNSPPAPDDAPAPPALREDAGQVRRVVCHWHPQLGKAAGPVFDRFLGHTGTDVEVVWVVASDDDLGDLERRFGSYWVRPSRVLVTGVPITGWSKDRCVVLARPGEGRATLLVPRRAESPNPLRTNDGEVPWRMARKWPGRFAVRELPLDFDGGDFYITTERAFVHVAVLAKNPTWSPPQVRSNKEHKPGAAPGFEQAEAMRRYLAGELGRDVVWVGDPLDPDAAPPHHVGMFLTVVGRYAVVGDVRIDWPANELAALLAPAGGPADPATREQLADALDAVANQMAELGYTVLRVPLLPSATPRAWISYNNGVADATGDGVPVFHMPTFNAPALDAAAREVFERAGCRVRPVDCSAAWPLGGTLRCLTLVTDRGGCVGRTSGPLRLGH